MSILRPTAREIAADVLFAMRVPLVGWTIIVDAKRRIKVWF